MKHRLVISAAVVAALLAFLALAAWWMVYAWTRFDAPMTGHGWTALVLGIVFTLIVGLGLAALIVHSHRRGYDEPPKIVKPDAPADPDPSSRRQT